jgi:hypothetical protein
MNITKILTPQIIGILFNVEDPSEIEETTMFINDMVLETQTNLAKDHLLEQGVSQQEIDEYFDNGESSNTKITQLLASEEMAQKYTDIYNTLLELIYKQQLPTLDEQKKAQLDALLQLEDLTLKADLSGLGVYQEAYQAIQDIKNSGQVTEDQIKEALGKAFDETLANNGTEQVEQPAQEVVTDMPVETSEQTPMVDVPVVESQPTEVAQEEAQAPDQPNI